MINHLDGRGRFQKIVLWGVLSPLMVILPLSWMNEIFLLNVPTHWCDHPMQKGMNATELLAWKQCFLPDENHPDGTLGFKKCKIYEPIEEAERFWRRREWDGSECYLGRLNATAREVDCRKGIAYDHSEFSSTIVTSNDWVCAEGMKVPGLYTFGTIGGIVGTFVFSYAGDVFGRKGVLFFTLTMVSISTILRVFVWRSYLMHQILKFVASACYVATFQMPYSLITEICDAGFRSIAVGITVVGW